MRIRLFTGFVAVIGLLALALASTADWFDGRVG
jgi:hypothetical protein